MKAGTFSVKTIVVPLCAIGWLILWFAGGPPQGLAANDAQSVSKAIPDVLVHVDADMGHADEPVRVIIVDKARQRVRLYRHVNQWQTIAKWPCSTGKKTGPKEREGDQRRPLAFTLP